MMEKLRRTRKYSYAAVADDNPRLKLARSVFFQKAVLRLHYYDTGIQRCRFDSCKTLKIFRASVKWTVFH